MSDALDWAGRTVVITGVGRVGQVGEAVAHAFARRGAHLVIISRNAQEVAERAAELKRVQAQVDAYACDLTHANDVSRVAAAVEVNVPVGVDAVVCLAGGFASSGSVADSSTDVWQQMLAINATTAYVTTRAFLPALRRRRGALVYFASAAALPDGRLANLSAYGAAKAGVVSLMRAVAAEERPHGVRANALAPTAIRTDSNVSSMGGDVTYVERETVASWVLFLCSDSSSSVTAQVVRLG